MLSVQQFIKHALLVSFSTAESELGIWVFIICYRKAFRKKEVKGAAQGRGRAEEDCGFQAACPSPEAD